MAACPFLWSVMRCSFRSPNHLATLRVGLDARMHDRVRFRCPKCGKESVVTIVMRGAHPSLAYAADPIPAERAE